MLSLNVWKIGDKTSIKAKIQLEIELRYKVTKSLLRKMKSKVATNLEIKMLMFKKYNFRNCLKRLKMMININNKKKSKQCIRKFKRKMLKVKQKRDIQYMNIRSNFIFF